MTDFVFIYFHNFFQIWVGKPFLPKKADIPIFCAEKITFVEFFKEKESLLSVSFLFFCFSFLFCFPVFRSVLLPRAEKVGGGQQKPKRRPYLLKKKALSTGFFESGSRREDTKGEPLLFKHVQHNFFVSFFIFSKKFYSPQKTKYLLLFNFFRVLRSVHRGKFS